MPPRSRACGVASELSLPPRQRRALDLSRLETGLILGAMRRVRPNLFAGPRYEYMHIDSDVPDKAICVEVSADQLSSRKSVPGMGLNYDTQDDHFYPRRGTNFNASVDFSVPDLGSDQCYQVYYVAYNRFWPLGETGVSWGLSGRPVDRVDGQKR